MRARPTVPFMLTVALAATLSLGGECDDDDLTGIELDAEFDASLTGAAERPDPVTTDGTGTAFFDVDGTTVRFRVEVEDIQNVTLAHIHVGATDVAGPIVVELFNADGNPESFTDREVLAEATFTQADIQAASGIATLDALIAAMEAGNTYVNVHTTANPAGEIRGQIEER
ncbi:MAG: CHRD domain-containing protein [Gemmatimonadota bacterium]